MASVAHCTATFMSWPVDSARNAPWAAAWHALAGAPDRFAHANHSAYDLSSGVGPVNAGSAATSCSTISHAGLVLGSAAGAGGAGAAGAAGLGVDAAGWTGAGGAGAGPGRRGGGGPGRPEPQAWGWTPRAGPVRAGQGQERRAAGAA